LTVIGDDNNNEMMMIIMIDDVGDDHNDDDDDEFRFTFLEIEDTSDWVEANKPLPTPKRSVSVSNGGARLT